MAVSHSPISIYALGGLCEVGKNTYCIESDNSLIIIDAGVMFPDATLPGVDYVIPDYQKLVNSRQKIKALFITHGHEDHIGGIPFLVQSLNIPVIYAPKLAAALIKVKLADNRIKTPVNIVEYDENSIININEFKVSFFRVTHSIPDSFGVVVDTPEGRIMHTGDFKIDLTPVGPKIELNKIAALGTEGVDLLLSDSTNAEIEGYTPSEKNVLKSIQEIFENTHGRLILSTFSSNISRIQQICQVAVEHHRKIAIIGRSMENAVLTAREFGYIKIPGQLTLRNHLTEDKRFDISAGPYMAFGIHGTVKEKYISDVDDMIIHETTHKIDAFDESVYDKINQARVAPYKRFDFGFCFTTTFEFRRYCIGANFDMGLTDITKPEHNVGNTRTRSIGVFFGYMFR